MLSFNKNSGRHVNTCESCQVAEVNVLLQRASTETIYESYGFCEGCYDSLKYNAGGRGETVRQYWESIE